MMQIIGTSLIMLFATSVFALSPPEWQTPTTGSGHTWPGLTWSLNVNSYGTPGWIGSNPIDMGGGDWIPRVYEKRDYNSRCDASIDNSTLPPYRTTGRTIKVYSVTKDATNGYNAMWWWYERNRFGALGYTDNSTNRFDFYLKVVGDGWSDPVNHSNNEVGKNIEIGTYTCSDGSCPQEGSGNHYYHLLALHAGGWYHVQLNEHPEHRRGDAGGAAQPNDPSLATVGHYFSRMSQFYIESGLGSSPNSTIDYYVADFNFSTVASENEGIGSMAVGYFPVTGKWEISYSDMSFIGTNPYAGDAKSKFDIRYSYSQITAANFSSATQIVPLFNKVTGTNFHRHDEWHKQAWTDFTLPVDAFSQAKVYFAIKDVSATVDGDNHDAPTSAIRTIDYRPPKKPLPPIIRIF